MTCPDASRAFIWRNMPILTFYATTITAIAIAIGYLFLSDIWAEDPPEWLEVARTRPVIESAALSIRDVLPESVVGQAGAHLKKARDRAILLDSARRAVERLSQPPKTSAPATRPEYNERKQ